MIKSILLLFLLFSIGTYAVCQKDDATDENSSANDFMHQDSYEELARAFESSDRDDWQKPDEVIKFLGNITDKTVVDLGSGSGYFSFRLAHAGANVIAADIDANFLEMIAEKREKLNIEEEKLKTVKISNSRLDIEMNSADIIFLVNVYHHLPNRVRYFNAVNDILKQHGKIVIIDFFKKTLPVGPPKNHKIELDDVVNELKEAGYEQIELNTELLPYQYIITASKF